MDRKHLNPFRAPWRTGTGLSCSVFDVHGGMVATIYAHTHEEQRRRLHLVKAAPKMRAALSHVHEMLTTPGTASAENLHNMLVVVARAMDEADGIDGGGVLQ